jgi:hypothetical protein
MTNSPLDGKRRVWNVVPERRTKDANSLTSRLSS